MDQVIDAYLSDSSVLYINDDSCHCPNIYRILWRSWKYQKHIKNPPKPILGQILIIYYITKENLGQSEKKKTQNRHMVFSFKFGSLTVIGLSLQTLLSLQEKSTSAFYKCTLWGIALSVKETLGQGFPSWQWDTLLSNEVLKRVWTV